MAKQNHTISFNSSNKGIWLSDISRIHGMYSAHRSPCKITLSFNPSITQQQIEPVHLVTLACLIQYLFDKGHSVYMNRSEPLYDYIFNDLKFSAYWSGGQNHVEARSSDNIFNLWRIVESEKDLYARNVEQYFTRNYFEGKDLSAINVSLVEAFYNVFDHANANNNAFSLLHYDLSKNKLSVAIADFGIGITESVRNFNHNIQTDHDAIRWAIDDHSTVKSTTHNKGLGMGNILAVASTGRIFSGYGLCIKISDDIKSTFTTFRFPGTLIYLDIDLSSFEEIEILDSFSF